MHANTGEASVMEDDLDTAPKFWRPESDDDGISQPRAQNSYKCTNCRAIKWYPPLLTLSTLMSGVFCWLYLTKPVQVTQTVIEPTGVSDSGALVQESQTSPGDLVIAKSSVPPPASFDPEQSGLPGESSGPSAEVASVVPGQDVQPIIVPRAKAIRFEPMTAEEIESALSSRGESPVEVAPEDLPAVELTGEERDDLPATEEIGSDLEGTVEEEALEKEITDADSSQSVSLPGLEDMTSEAISARRVAISLMGELLADYSEPEAALADSKKE